MPVCMYVCMHESDGIVRIIRERAVEILLNLFVYQCVYASMYVCMQACMSLMGLLISFESVRSILVERKYLI